MLEIWNIASTDLWDGSHVHKHSSVTIKAENVLGWLSNGDSHGDAACMSHGTDAEEVTVAFLV